MHLNLEVFEELILVIGHSVQLSSFPFNTQFEHE